MPPYVPAHRVVFYATFNSLFEMPRGGPGNRTPALKATFNSLFEMPFMMTVPSRPMPTLASFNSLFEMPMPAPVVLAMISRAVFQFSI